MKLDHFAFEVSNLDTALDFYVNGLGFNVQYKYTDPEVHETLAVLELAGGKLELIQVLNAENQPQPFEPIALRAQLCPHLALQTEDIDEVLTTIKARGVTFFGNRSRCPGLQSGSLFAIQIRT